MEKAKNIVLVVCGIMLFFGSQAAYGTWLYLFAWVAGVGMLILGIYGLAKNRKHKNANILYTINLKSFALKSMLNILV